MSHEAQHPEDGQVHDWPGLCEPDREALDALVEAGFEVDRVPEPMRARARAAASVLGLLHTHAGEPDRLIASALERIGHGETLDGDGGPRLCAADDDALEALVSSGYDPRRVASGMRDRAERGLALLRNLDTDAGAQSGEFSFAREALIRKTLDRVANAGRAAGSELDASPRRGWRRPRVADLVSVAAVLVVGTALAWSVASSMRAGSQRAVCQANLAGLGGAFAQYAGDYQDALPLASRSVPGTPWWHVGDPERSNSANLYTLRRLELARADMLACAGNPWARTDLPTDSRDWPELRAVSYSYQNMFAAERPTPHAQPSMIVLVDRSPVVLRAVRGERFDPMENSPNHGGRGQSALRADGSGLWMPTPETAEGDNIWLPRGLETIARDLQGRGRGRESEPLKGIESPASAKDVFVGP